MTMRDDAMPDDPSAPQDGPLQVHASIPVTYHWARAERRQQLGRSRRPECVVVGHAWTPEPEREGWTLCLVCEVVRAP